MAEDIRTKAQLAEAFVDGWVLYPRKTEAGYILQQGRAGKGGKSLTVTEVAVRSFMAAHPTKNIGTFFEPEYVRA